jgi:hypothetical protein
MSEKGLLNNYSPPPVIGLEQKVIKRGQIYFIAFAGGALYGLPCSQVHVSS